MTAPATLSLGPVTLGVADLERSRAYYREVLGLAVLEEQAGALTLGVPGRALLRLREHPGARPASPNTTGLYHYALLVPTRGDLGRWLRHAAGLGARVGQADHLVSEAFYLSDPDGHGIEVYRDRPRGEWAWDGPTVRMASDPIDLRGLLAEAGPEAPFAGLPAGTVMGHVHLRVADLGATEAFYGSLLGLDMMARWPGALFMAAGGYHHHFGLNTWQSAAGRPAPQGSAHLEEVVVHLGSAGELDDLEGRFRAAGVPVERGAALVARDPAGNALRFEV